MAEQHDHTPPEEVIGLKIQNAEIKYAMSLRFVDEAPEEVARIPASRDRIEINWPVVERVAKRVQETPPEVVQSMGEMIALALWLVREQCDIKIEMTNG